MTRLLFTVADTFEIRGRGIVLVPGIAPQGEECFRAGDAIELRRQDGTIIPTRIAGLELFTPGPEPYTVPILLPSNISKSDVPIGTEVWSLNTSANQAARQVIRRSSEGFTESTHRDYVPAAGSDWLLAFYDPLFWITGAGKHLDRLIEQANIDSLRVLDVGCGTGNLIVRLGRRHPAAVIVGIDPDPKVLTRARRKAEWAGISAHFEQGYAQSLPVADASFDRVLSSFMLHHLPLEQKRAMLAEVRRVLAPGGSFHLLDFMPSAERNDGLLARLLHNDAALRDNAAEQIAVLLGEAGFATVDEPQSQRTLMGRIGFVHASDQSARI